jgi:O-antigen ligase
MLDIVKLRTLPLTLGMCTLFAYFALSPFLFGAITRLGAILALLSVIVFVASEQRFSSFSRDSKLLILGFVIYIACAFLSLANNQDWSVAGHRLERYIPFLLSFFLLFLFIKIRGKLNNLLLNSACLGGFLTAGFALYQQIYLGMDRTGLQTGMGINSFAHMSSLLTLILLSFLLFSNLSKPKKLILCSSAAASVYAVFSTFSRLSIIALLVSVILYAVVFIVNAELTKRQKRIVGGLTLISLAGVIVVIMMTPFLSSRMTEMFVNASNFFHGDTSYTSTSARLMMWEGGFKMGMKNFWIGSGVGDTPNDYKLMMQTGQVPFMTQPITVLHNVYVDAFATTGIIGLLVMLGAVFAFPFYVFMERVKNSSNNSQVFVASVTGLAVLLNNFIFGLGHSWLYTREVSFNLILVLVLFAIAANPLNGSGKSESSAKQ